MLAFALLVLRMTPRPLPHGIHVASGPVGHAAAMALAGHVAHAAHGTGWQQHLPRLAAAHGLRDTRILESGALDCMVLVTHCRSCLRRRRACRPERRRLKRAARRIRRNARVEEVACRIRGHAACVFHVDMRWR